MTVVLQVTQPAPAWRLQYADIRRGRRIVLRAADIDLPADQVIGLVGINGAGKTTLMMHLADVLRTGARGPFHRPPVGPVTGYAPQRPVLPHWLTGAGITGMFGLAFNHLTARFPELLLDEIRDTPGGAMSVGQTQALSIALALTTVGRVILLDEPFAPLDFRRRIGLSRILRQQRDCPVLVASQSAAELMEVCSWIVVLRDSDCAFNGPITDLTGGVRGEPARSILEERILSLLQDH